MYVGVGAHAFLHEISSNIVVPSREMDVISSVEDTEDEGSDSDDDESSADE